MYPRCKHTHSSSLSLPLWSLIVDDEKLRALYQEYKDQDDALDQITNAFYEQGRSALSVTLRLNKLGLQLAKPKDWRPEVRVMFCSFL